MKFSVNSVTLVGNITKDPVVRQLPNGSVVMSLSVATSESWIDKNTSEKKEKTQFHNCTIWGKQAETAQRFLKKGHRVYIEGSIENRSYEVDGVTKYATDIRVTDVMPLFRQEKSGTNSKPETESKAKTDNKIKDFDKMAEDINEVDNDEDIPF